MTAAPETIPVVARSRSRTPVDVPTVPAPIVARSRSRTALRFVAEHRGTFYEITEGPLKGVRYVVAPSCVTNRPEIRFAGELGGVALFGDPYAPGWCVRGERATMTFHVPTRLEAMERFRALIVKPEEIREVVPVPAEFHERS